MDSGREKSTLQRQRLHFVKVDQVTTSPPIEKTTRVDSVKQLRAGQGCGRHGFLLFVCLDHRASIPIESTARARFPAPAISPLEIIVGQSPSWEEPAILGHLLSDTGLRGCEKFVIRILVLMNTIDATGDSKES
jgi:hypothetical protein